MAGGNDERVNLLISALVDGLENVASLTGQLKELEGEGKKQIPDNTGKLREGAGRTADAFRDANSESEEWLDKLGKMKGELALAAGALYGLQKTLGGAAGASSEFQQGMAEVSTLLDDLSDMGELTEGVRQLSVEFGGDVNTNAKALYDIISAGASDSAEAMEILRVANELAIGGVTDVSTAADGLTSTMNAYGDEVGSAAEVSDAFFTAVKAGKTTIAELSANIGKVAPLAKTAGVSLDELLASVASLTAGGVSTSESMTQIKGALTSIIKPSKEAQDLAAKLGIEFNAAALQTQGWAGFLEQVKTATGGNIETMGKLFGSVEGLNGVLTLTGASADKFADTMDSMGKKAGATGDAVEKMWDTPAARAARFQASLKEVNLALGDAVTAFAPLLDMLTRAMKGFTDLEPGTRTIVAGIGGLALALPPAIMATGSLVKALGILRGAFAVNAAAAGTNAAAMGAQTAATVAATVATRALNVALRATPIGLVVTGLTLGASALGLFGENAGDSAEELERLNDQVDRLTQNNREITESLKKIGRETGITIESMDHFNDLVARGLIVADEAEGTWVSVSQAMAKLGNETRQAALAQATLSEQIERAPISEQAKAIADLGLATQAWSEQLSAVDLTAKDADKQIAELIKTATAADAIEMGGLLAALEEIREKTPELAALIEKELIGAIQKLDSQQLSTLQASLQQAYEHGTISAEQFAERSAAVVESAAKQMGISLKESLGELTPATEKALRNLDTMMDGMRALGKTTEEQSKVAFDALSKAYAGAKTKADIDAVNARLADMGKQGLLTAQQLQILGASSTESMRKLGGATEDAANKQNQLNDRIREFKNLSQETGEDLKNQSDQVPSIMGGWIKFFNSIRDGYYEMSDTVGEFFDDVVEKNADLGLSFNQFFQNLGHQMQGIERLYADQAGQVENLMQQLESGNGVTLSMIEHTERAAESMHWLGEEQLGPLRNALASARRELESINSSASSALDTVRDELDRLEGNEEAIHERRMERRREELEAQLAVARAAGSSEAVADLQEALRMLEQIDRLEKDSEKRERRRRPSDTSTQQPTIEPIKTVNVNIGSQRVRVLAGDEDALLAALESARGTAA